MIEAPYADFLFEINASKTILFDRIMLAVKRTFSPLI